MELRRMEKIIEIIEIIEKIIEIERYVHVYLVLVQESNILGSFSF